MGSIKDKLKEKFLGEKELSDNSKTSKPKKKRAKARKSNICDTCNQNILENEKDNVVACCMSCNTSKGDKTLTEWRKTNDIYTS